MNQQSPRYSPFIPLLLLALSLFFILGWQVYSAQTNYSNLQAMLANPQRKQALDQSQAVQKKMEKLFSGLLDLADSGDDSAQQIVKQNGIKRTPKSD